MSARRAKVLERGLLVAATAGALFAEPIAPTEDWLQAAQARKVLRAQLDKASSLEAIHRRPELRQEAHRALVAGGELAVQVLIEELETRRVTRFFEIQKALVALGPPSKEALCRAFLLRASKPEARHQATQILAVLREFSGPEVLELFRRELQSPEPNFRIQALRGLAKQGTWSDFGNLTRFFLERFATQESLEATRENLDGVLALRTLGNRFRQEPSPEGFPNLIRALLERGSFSLRWMGAQLLGARLGELRETCEAFGRAQRSDLDLGLVRAMDYAHEFPREPELSRWMGELRQGLYARGDPVLRAALARHSRDAPAELRCWLERERSPVVRAALWQGLGRRVGKDP